MLKYFSASIIFIIQINISICAVEYTNHEIALKIIELNGIKDKLDNSIDGYVKAGFGPTLKNDDKKEIRIKFLTAELSKNILENYYCSNLITLLTRDELKSYLLFLESDLGTKLKDIDPVANELTKQEFKKLVLLKIKEANEL